MMHCIVLFYMIMDARFNFYVIIGTRLLLCVFFCFEVVQIEHFPLVLYSHHVFIMMRTFLHRNTISEHTFLNYMLRNYREMHPQ